MPVWRSFLKPSQRNIMSPSIYDQIGGAPAVEATVEAFYVRVLADPLLIPFFAKTHMGHQKQAQIKFVTTALGGPQLYKGRTMFNAHKKFDIEQRHFDRVVFHMTETLASLKVPAHLIGMHAKHI
jgi:hemoglobin